MDFIESKHKAEQELRDNDVEFDHSISAGLNWNPHVNRFDYGFLNRKLNHCTLYVRHYNYTIQRVFQCELGRFYKLIQK